MMHTLSQLDAGCVRALKEGYSLFISAYTVSGDGVQYHVTLNKYMTGGGSLKVEGSGATIVEAFETCFANFPKNPLQSGVGWVNNQLTPPAAEDATFTETDDNA